jgi:hypothetical protein
VWHSTQCVKPTAPAAILQAQAETSGEDMNALMTQHNAFVDAAQAYMNCLKDEATRDQADLDQVIITGAQKAIGDIQDTVVQTAPHRQTS